MAASIQLSALAVESSSSWGGGTSSLQLCATPDGSKKLLKLYNQQARDEVGSEALHSVVEFPLVLPGNQRSALEAAACWPDTIVLEDRAVVGVLMPLASAQFFEGSDESMPRHMSRLGRPPGEGPYYQLPQKIARIGKLVSFVQILHRHGVVVGDINPRNVLIGAADASPQICLIDCDSVVLHGKSAFQARQPPDWTIPVPLGGNDFSTITDYGKLALLALRALYEDFALPSFDLDALEIVLKRREIELLDRAARGRFADQDKIAWGSLAGAWEKLDRGSAELYYRNDEFEFQTWSSDVWPVQETAAGTHFQVETPQPEIVSVPKVKAGARLATKAEAQPAAWAEIVLGSTFVLIGLASLLAALIVVVLGGVMLGSGDVAVLFGSRRVPAAPRSSGAVTMAVITGLLAVLGAGVVGSLAEWPKRVMIPLLAGIALISALVFFGPPQQHVSAVAGKVPWLGSIVPHAGE